MKNVVGIVLALVFVTGCTETVPVWNGDGEKLQTVACLDNQLFGGMTSCLKELEKVCPNGYYWKGNTNHPLAHETTEPDRGTPLRPEPGFDRAPEVFNMVRDYKVKPGDYGWSPRIVENRGGYQYMTVKCKQENIMNKPAPFYKPVTDMLIEIKDDKAYATMLLVCAVIFVGEILFFL